MMHKVRVVAAWRADSSRVGWRALRSALVVAIALAGPLGGSGCGRPHPLPQPSSPVPAPATGTPLPGGEAVFATEYEPEILNFLVAHYDHVYRLTHRAIFEPLVARAPVDPGDAEWQRFQGVLAESYRFADAGRELTLRLRENVRWHDGELFSARDVLNTIELVRRPHNQSPLRSDFADLVQASAPDPHTVVLRYSRPAAFALDRLEALHILPAHIYGANSSLRHHWANRSPVGTGPYRFVRWIRGRELVLERYRDHWAQAGHLDRVRYRFLPPPADVGSRRAARMKQLLADFGRGQVDAITLPAGMLPQIDPRVRQSARVQVYDGPRVRLYLLNLARARWKSRDVRRAIAHLLDGERIVREVYGGRGRVIATPFWPRLPGYEHALVPRRADRVLAERLLARAGWQRGPDGRWRQRPGGPALAVEVAVSRSEESRRELALVRSALASVGLEVRQVSLHDSALRAHVERSAYDLAALEWWMRSEQFLVPFFRSNGRDNFSRYSRREVDELLDRIVRTFDPNRRAALERQLGRLLHEDAPCVLALSLSDVTLVRRGLEGYRPSGQGISLAGLWRSDLVPDAIRRVTASR